MDAYISSQPGPSRPGILLLPEIFGINGAMRLAADQFARANFTVLAPDLFSQIEPRLELGYTDQDRNRAIAIWQKMDDAVALTDSQIGRASCRERVCQYVKISVVADSLKQKEE